MIYKDNKINNITCRFENSDLEKEYIDYWWQDRLFRNIKIILGVAYFVGLFVIFDDYKNLGSLTPYYIGYHIFSWSLLAIFLFSKEDLKKKYFEYYFMITFVGFMNCGAWSYHFSPAEFPPGEGVVVSMILFGLIIYPFGFINSIIGTLLTAVPFMIMLIGKGTMQPSQISYLFILPFVFIVLNKRSKELSDRRIFLNSKIIESNRKLMQETLKRYFGETLTEKILLDEGELKGDNIWISISFTDISAYSTIIEHMSPETAVKFLNQYFTSMHDVIEEYNGQIINYIGDSVMVVYGAPKKFEDHEVIAVKCAIAMREKLVELNKKWDETEFSRYWKNHGIDQITARTGIHTGSVIAGNIGSERMLQYSTIGDTVNVASRLEQRNKEFGTDILFSHKIYTSLTKDLYDEAEYRGEINLKGRDTGTKTYSI